MDVISEIVVDMHPSEDLGLINIFCNLVLK